MESRHNRTPIILPHICYFKGPTFLSSSKLSELNPADVNLLKTGVALRTLGNITLGEYLKITGALYVEHIGAI